MNLRVPGSISAQARCHWRPSIAAMNWRATAVGEAAPCSPGAVGVAPAVAGSAAATKASSEQAETEALVRTLAMRKLPNHRRLDK